MRSGFRALGFVGLLGFTHSQLGQDWRGPSGAQPVQNRVHLRLKVSTHALAQGRHCFEGLGLEFRVVGFRALGLKHPAMWAGKKQCSHGIPLQVQPYRILLFIWCFGPLVWIYAFSGQVFMAVVCLLRDISGGSLLSRDSRYKQLLACSLPFASFKSATPCFSLDLPLALHSPV